MKSVTDSCFHCEAAACIEVFFFFLRFSVAGWHKTNDGACRTRNAGSLQEHD